MQARKTITDCLFAKLLPQGGPGCTRRCIFLDEVPDIEVFALDEARMAWPVAIGSGSGGRRPTGLQQQRDGKFRNHKIEVLTASGTRKTELNPP